MSDNDESDERKQDSPITSLVPAWEPPRTPSLLPRITEPTQIARTLQGSTIPYALSRMAADGKDTTVPGGDD